MTDHPFTSATPASPTDWLDPEAVSSVESLEFLASQVVEGFLTGLHTSPYHGYNQEFAQHRPYQAGDDLRYLDWRLYGRTDRFYIKQFEADTNLRATILLDASASMDYCGDDPPHEINQPRPSRRGLTKFLYGQRLAAALAHLLIRQRDATGLALLSNRILEYVPARSTGQHLRYLLRALSEVNPGGETALGPLLAEMAGRLSRRGVIILISDLIDEPEILMENLALLRHHKHEVVVFHLVDAQEINLKYRGAIRFRDPETGATLETDPDKLRGTYIEQLETLFNFYRDSCLEHHISYERVVTATPLHRALPAYLAHRKERQR